MLRTLTVAALFVTFLSTSAAAQNANQAVAAASKAMGVDNLTSITFSGTARNGAFGQSADINNPLGPNNNTQITQYTRTITFAPVSDPMALVSRAFGPTQPPSTPDVPNPMPGQYNQNITAQQLNTNMGQALNVWLTPWGFLKGAAANNATARQEGGQTVVSWSPANLKSPSGQMYTVTGYINNENLVTKVETRVEHNVVGDNLIEAEFSNYTNRNGVQVPGRIVMRQFGLPFFEATITAATPNPANLTALLTAPPAPARGGGAGRAGGPPQGGRGGGAPQQAAGPEVERLGEGVFRIGGNYTSLAIDMGDHIVVVESGQSDARGQAVMAAAKQAIPNKPIRFVVTSHPHFDHAGGLQAAVAEGATILTHENNADLLRRALNNPRTLLNDSLAQNPRQATVEGVGDRRTLRGTNNKVVDLFHIPNQHTNGMLGVHLPAERVLWTGDVTIVNPSQAQLGVVRDAVEVFNRLNLQYERWIPAHPPNPNRPLTKADVDAAVAAGSN